MTPSLIQKKSLEIVSSRGRKGSDPKALLGQLEALSELAVRFGPRVEIPILMQVITAQFDMQRNIDDYMETPSWRSCAGHIERIGSIMENGEGWKIGPMTEEEEELASDMMMSTMMGGKGAGKNKMKGMMGGADGAMSAMAAEDTLINPTTVSEYYSWAVHHRAPCYCCECDFSDIICSLYFFTTLLHNITIAMVSGRS